jgi:hypothetical protein
MKNKVEILEFGFCCRWSLSVEFISETIEIEEALSSINPKEKKPITIG